MFTWRKLSLFFKGSLRYFFFLTVIFYSSSSFAIWTNAYSCALPSNVSNLIASNALNGIIVRSAPNPDGCIEGLTSWETWSPSDTTPCDDTYGSWSFDDQECKTTPDTCADAMASSGSSEAHFYHNEDGQHCSLGPQSPGGGAPQCQTETGAACYSDEDTPDNVCGTFNGEPICVASAGGNSIGTSSQSPGATETSSSPSTVVTSSEDTSTNQTTTTETTSTTTTTTETVPVVDDVPLEAQLDPLSTGQPPYVCDSGQYAADIISCDTSLTCPSNFYINYGVCVAMPTYTTVTEDTSSTSTTTVTDSTTGEVLSTVDSTQTSSTPIIPSSQSGDETPTGVGDCDPTDDNYAVCISYLEEVGDSYADDLVVDANNEATSLLDGFQSQAEDFIGTADDNVLAAEPGLLQSAVLELIPVPSECVQVSIPFPMMTFDLKCERFNEFKVIFGWFLYITTIIYLFYLALTPIESKV